MDLARPDVTPGGQPHWGWIVVGMMIAMALTMARSYGQDASRKLFIYGAVLVGIDAATALAAVVSNPLLRVGLYGLNLACDLAIIYACIRHIRGVRWDAGILSA